MGDSRGDISALYQEKAPIRHPDAGGYDTQYAVLVILLGVFAVIMLYALT
jgi:hypothetical protein